MNENTKALALEAITGAAERLGVDPFRLARYLGDGRLADVLEALGRPSVVGSRRIVGLAESYLDFLEQEIQIQDGLRAPSRRWGP